MKTIKIKVNNEVFNHFLWFLNRFSKDEIEIIEIEKYDRVKEEVVKDLESALVNPEKYISLGELDTILEDTLKKYGA